jgi:plasmid stabilization system protein ParE
MTDTAQHDVTTIHDYAARHAPGAADAWIQELERQIKTPELMPARCPVIPEALEMGHEYRHLIYGNYRTIFRVERRVVWIVRVLHGAQLLDTAILEK